MLPGNQGYGKTRTEIFILKFPEICVPYKSKKCRNIINHRLTRKKTDLFREQQLHTGKYQEVKEDINVQNNLQWKTFY